MCFKKHVYYINNDLSNSTMQMPQRSFILETDSYNLNKLIYII